MRKRAALQVEPLEGRALLSIAFVDRGGSHTLASARAVWLDAIDARATILGRVDDAGPRDVYRFSPNVSGVVRLSLNAMGVNRVQVVALGHSGRAIARMTVSIEGTKTAFRVAAAQDVYIRIQGTGHGIGVYQLTLEEPAAAVSTAPNPPDDSIPVASLTQRPTGHLRPMKGGY